MLKFLLIFAIISLIACILILYIIYNYHSIENVLYKINVCENKINELLKNKTDLINRIVNIIERELKIEIKIFEEFKKINSNNLNNYDIDILLDTTFDEVSRISEDHPSLSNVKSFDGLINDINECNIILGGAKKMHSKYVAIYNKSIKKFPKKVIAKFKKLSMKSFYEIREVEKEIDFNLN